MITEKAAKACGWKQTKRYDLVVAGGGPAGIGAAIAAARRGVKVILLESAGYLGGVGTQSCVPLYFGFGLNGRQSTAGLSEEFVRRMDAQSAASLILNDGCAMPEFRPIGGRPLTAKVQLQSETMKLIYRRMLAEAGADCLLYAHVTDAVVKEDRILSLLVSCREGPVQIAADTFIDATGDALVFAMAGARVRTYPREDGMHHSMFFFVGGVTPFDSEYNCRLYREAYAKGLLPEKVWDHFGYSVQLNPGVVQIAVCYDVGDAMSSKDMSRMDFELRENVFSIVDFLRKEMPGFRSCYLLETASHIGVRAGQGIVGLDTVSEALIADTTLTDEPVALIGRTYGAHSTASRQFTSGWSRKETGMSAVPFGCLKSISMVNALAAGRCISSEPRVVGTFRMMNTCMTLGEAAGIACYLALNKGIMPQSVPYNEMLPHLLESGFLLNPAITPIHHEA